VDEVPSIPGVERLSSLDEGGFGKVYVGWEPDNSRHVAVKVVRIVGHADEATRRFERERESMGRLSGHSSIVALYRSGQLPDGRWFLVMPYFSNGSVEARIRSGPLPTSVAAAYGAQVADALAFAHQLAVVHGDVKPANIMVGRSEDLVLLTDFGVAHLIDRPTSMHAHSPGYASPEQRWGYAVTPASDVWSLGATLYAFVTGMVPPEPTLDPPASPQGDVGASVANELRRRGQPSGFVDVVERCMQRDPSRRPDARTVSQELKRLFDDALSRSRSGPAEAPAPKQPTTVRHNAWASTPWVVREHPGNEVQGTAASSGAGWKVAVGVCVGAVVALFAIGGFVVINGSGSGAKIPSGVTTATSDASTTSTNIPTTAVSTTSLMAGAGETTSSTSSTPTTSSPRLSLPRRLIAVGASASGVSDPAVDAAGNPVSYQPANAIDGDPATAWRPPEYENLGHSVTVDLGRHATITRVGIIPGYAKIDVTSGQDWYFTLRRVRQVVWTFQNGEQFTQSLSPDSRAMQYIDVPPIVSRSARVEIREVTAHGGLDFVAISEMEVWGRD
jgi:serine/threonine protein kinase